MYKYGGIYFDTDVEVIKPLDDIVSKGPFMGCERDGDKNKAAAIAAAPGLGLYKEMLDLYDTLHFKNSDGSLNLKTVVQYTTETLVKHGLKNTNQVQKCASIYIYPREYFCPKNIDTGKLEITENTYTIHHFDGSWLNWCGKTKQVIKLLISDIFGENTVAFLKRIVRF